MQQWQKSYQFHRQVACMKQGNSGIRVATASMVVAAEGALSGSSSERVSTVSLRNNPLAPNSEIFSIARELPAWKATRPFSARAFPASFHCLQQAKIHGQALPGPESHMLPAASNARPFLTRLCTGVADSGGTRCPACGGRRALCRPSLHLIRPGC